MWLSSQLRAIFTPVERSERRRSSTSDIPAAENVPTDPSSAPTASARVRRFISINEGSKAQICKPGAEEWMEELAKKKFDGFLSPGQLTECEFGGSDLDRSFLLVERTEGDAFSTFDEKQCSQSSLGKSDCDSRRMTEQSKASMQRGSQSLPTGSFHPVYELIVDPPISQKVKLKRGVVGLKNPRLMCYLNAAIQCLFSAKALREYLITLVTEQPGLEKTCELTFLLGLLAKRMFSLKKGKVHSSRLWQFMSKSFRSDVMHDAPEAVCFLLNTVDAELKAANIDVGLFPSSSQALAWFEGSLFSQIECCSCHSLKTTLQVFMELSVSVTPKLSQSLRSLSAEEVLDAYRCRNCDALCPAKKQLQLDRLPDHLLITFLRFQREFQSYKIDSYVKFRKTLTMRTKTEMKLYSLLSVVVHKGTLESGHYVAYCRRGHKWFLFDDELYAKVKLKEVLRQEAYILLYEHR